MDAALVTEAELVEVPLVVMTSTADVDGLLGGLRAAGLLGWLRVQPDPPARGELVVAVYEGRPVALLGGALSADVPAEELLMPLIHAYGFEVPAAPATDRDDLEPGTEPEPELEPGPGPERELVQRVAEDGSGGPLAAVDADAAQDDDRHAGLVAAPLYLLGGGRPVGREYALEVAALLGTDVVMASVGRWRVVAPVDGVNPPGWGVPWPRSARPVLSLVGRGEVLDVTAHLPKEERRPASQWALARTLPGWSWSSSPDHVEHLVHRQDLAGLREDVRRAVLQLQGQADEVPIARSLDLDASRAGRLRGLLDAPAGPATASDVTEVLGLPDVVPALLAGRVHVRDLPGAVAAERRGAVGVAVESVLSRPVGNSPIARLRRWDHDRPAWSVTYIAVEVLLAAVAAVLGTAESSPLSQRPWDVVFVVAAVVLGVDAVGNTVLLAAVRRRARRARA